MERQFNLFGEGDKPTKEAVIITKEDLDQLTLKELNEKFIELTGFIGTALDRDNLIQLILAGDKETAIIALREAQAEEDRQDIAKTYRVG